jgi:hypothetical protein
MRRTSLGVALAGLLTLVFVGGVLVLSDPQELEPRPLTLANPDLTYDPLGAGEDLPAGYRQLLDRDQIAPIYNPEFTTPDHVDWPREMLVIGIVIDDSSKAYPVTPLNQREMVIDSLEGIPILVTW